MTTLTHAPVGQLLERLALEPVGEDSFCARNSVTASTASVFGGQVIAQALSAAAYTVPAGRDPHSLHGYFVFPGHPGKPITYRVDRLRDGHSFTSRRVVAEQDTSRGKQEIFHFTASFKKVSSRLEDVHQDSMAQVPPPHGLPEATDQPPAHVHPGVIALLSDLSGVLEARYAPASQGTTQVWFRVKGLTQEDLRPALHHILLAYLSDLTLLDSASPHHRTHSPNTGAGMAVSLDHAMWFHRPARADEWLLYEQNSPSFADSRALAHARIYTADGLLAASVVQEGAMRLGRETHVVPAVADITEEEIDPFSWAVAKPETD